MATLSGRIPSLHSLGMGGGTDSPRGTAVVDGGTAVLTGAGGDDATVVPPAGAGPPSGTDLGRRRFTVTMLIANAIAAVPFLWILWAPWEAPDPLRQALSQTNFYDLQTRAMFHGHLWVSNGRLGVEAFVHDGRQYTYFGLFPSLIRMPILLVTSSLDGRLTAPSMLLAWLATGLFASLLLWRVRVLIRGDAALGRAEATSFGLLATTIMGGSVFLILAATPYVYNEDLAWSICLTVGGLFALLGVLERPSWARVSASGLLVLAANLDRVTTGWACVVGAVMIAVWFGLGRGGRDNRRWCVPMLAVGLVPLLVGCAVNYAKFGVLFGLPVTDQVYSLTNAYRRRFLAANHNSEVGTAFAPTDALAYFRLDGLRFTSVFPFITLPASQNPTLAGVLFDKRYRTASLPSSMPLLFFLSCWGMITAFRPKPFGKAALTRLLLLASGTACAALLLWGYIAPRYLADFIPFLVLASGVAMVDIWRRLEGRRRPMRIGAFALIALVAVFTIAANVGMAVTPNEQWNPTQVLHYVQAQKAVGDLTGGTLKANVVRGSSLPLYGPADQLYVIGDCDGLYISNGENYSMVPNASFLRNTWMAVERGHGFQHTFRATFSRSASGEPAPVPLVSAGPDSVSVSVVPTARRLLRVSFSFASPDRTVHDIFGVTPLVNPGSTHQVVVITDLAKHLAQVSMDGTAYLVGSLDTTQPVHVEAQQADSGGTPPALSVTNITASTPQPTLCRSLIS